MSEEEKFEENINTEKKKATSSRKEARAKDSASKTKEKEKEVSGGKFAYFISANPENVAFDIRLAGQRYKGTWDTEQEYLCWRIPRELKENMLKHFFCIEGRIILGDE